MIKINKFLFIAIFWVNIQPIISQSNYQGGFLHNVPTKINGKILTNGNSIKLNWKQPEKRSGFIIVRSNEKIDTQSKFYAASLVKRVRYNARHNFRTFLDKRLPKGEYYYAIVAIDAIKKKNIKLIPNLNYTTKPLEILQDSYRISEHNSSNFPTLFVTNLQVKKEKHFIKISWQPIKKPNITYHIYRSEIPLSKASAFQNATKLISLHKGETSYLDNMEKLAPIVYYGVSVEFDGIEQIPLVENISYLKYKTGNNSYEYLKTKMEVKTTKAKKKYAFLKKAKRKIKNADSIQEERASLANLSNSLECNCSDIMDYRLYIPEGHENSKEYDLQEPFETEEISFTEYNKDLMAILIKTYNKKKYVTAIRELKGFVAQVQAPKEKSEALFFIGLSYFQRRMYDTALKYFLKDELKKYYKKDRVDFYIERCLESKG
ncbi:MAG: hypothetical protein H7A23_12380 [Leptospiraceae bacterium]|nr:hypothetical protein [Leptospiraceae bacterium]MCP5495345.1 hypothetical protein [Leptospiraceae bacterium]